MEKNTKRLTLFPAIEKEIKNDTLMAYMQPMLDLGLVPSVSPGIKFRVNGADKKIEPTEVMTIEFSDIPASQLTISIAAERIDILSTREDSWSDFREILNQLIPIIEKNNPDGISRAAVGSEETFAIGAGDVVQYGFYEEEAKDEKVRELQKRIARVESLRNEDGKCEKEYNIVLTTRAQRTEEDWNLTVEYDINTVPSPSKENLTGILPLFITSSIAIIENKA